MKTTYYFPHDYHARFDPKLSALIKEYGMEGYGVWWDLVEILHEQGGKLEKFPKLYSGLSHELKLNEARLQAIVNSMINEFSLLKEDKTHIWSDRVLYNFEQRKLKSSQRAEAGRDGGIISGQKRSKTKHLLEANKANEAKESKGKESIYNSGILNYFYHKYEKAFSKPYAVAAGKDYQIFADLALTHKDEEIKALIDKFFASTDDFIKKAGYTTGVFSSQVNKLQAKKQEFRLP